MTTACLIDETRARHFIEHYQSLLEQVALDTGLVHAPVAKQGLVHLLQAVRDALADKPALIPPALAALQAQGRPVPQDIVDAVATLRVGRWVYLRDTTGYSVLFDGEYEDVAYAVKCLTTPLKEMLGDSGAVITCGLLAYEGRVISDGLVGFVAWLGPGLRRDFNAALGKVRAGGHFHSDRVVPLPASLPAD
jgi:hypothetical protein